MKDFRPINMVGNVYKVMAKLLSRRLLSVMGSLVVEENRLLLKGGKLWMVH